MWRQSANHSLSLRWAWKSAPWEFQTKLLHYFFTSSNKSNFHRRIPGSIPGRLNLQIKITSKSWSLGPWLRVSLNHFMRHFTLFPNVGPRCRPFTILSACPFLDGWLIRHDTPRTLRTSWDTQAIDYSWANLDTFHAAPTSSSRIQDVDVILIWRFNLPGIEPGISRSKIGINNHRATDAYIKLDTCVSGGAIQFQL